MEEYQKIVNPLTRDEISPSMERNIWESESRDQGGFEPQARFARRPQFGLFAGWKAQIGRLAKSYPPKSFSKGELAMLLSIAGTGRKCWNRSHLDLLVLAHNTKWGVCCPRLGLILSVPFPVQSVWVNAWSLAPIKAEPRPETASALSGCEVRSMMVNEDTLEPLLPLIQWLRSISGVTSGDVVIIRAASMQRSAVKPEAHT